MSLNPVLLNCEREIPQTNENRYTVHSSLHRNVACLLMQWKPPYCGPRATVHLSDIFFVRSKPVQQSRFAWTNVTFGKRAKELQQVRGTRKKNVADFNEMPRCIIAVCDTAYRCCLYYDAIVLHNSEHYISVCSHFGWNCLNGFDFGELPQYFSPMTDIDKHVQFDLVFTLMCSQGGTRIYTSELKLPRVN